MSIRQKYRKTLKIVSEVFEVPPGDITDDRTGPEAAEARMALYFMLCNVCNIDRVDVACLTHREANTIGRGMRRCVQIAKADHLYHDMLTATFSLVLLEVL